MSQTAVATKASKRRPPPKSERGLLFWIRTNLFSSVYNTIMTLLAFWALFVTIPEFFQWAILDSVWYTEDPQACRNSAGACWAVVAEKHRVMMFGTFPYKEHWRGVLAVAVIIAMAIIRKTHHLEEFLTPIHFNNLGILLIVIIILIRITMDRVF